MLLARSALPAESAIDDIARSAPIEEIALDELRSLCIDACAQMRARPELHDRTSKIRQVIRTYSTRAVR